MKYLLDLIEIEKTFVISEMDRQAQELVCECLPMKHQLRIHGIEQVEEPKEGMDLKGQL